MKRSLIIGIVLCLLLLTACGAAEVPDVYDVEYGGKTYTVDRINSTITFDGHVCRYKLTESHNTTDFEVTYPDGSGYWWTQHEYGGGGGWSNDYSAQRYVSGETLWEVLEKERPKQERQSNYWADGLILVIAGVFEAAAPQTAWYLSYGWRFKDAEPSELALIAGRAGGVFMIVLGIIFFFI